MPGPAKHSDRSSESIAGPHARSLKRSPGIPLARKQGQSWAAGDSDLRFIDEIMGALDISPRLP